jgi:hypothetical protein
MWCVVPAPISAGSSSGSANCSGASSVEEARVKVRVADHGDVAKARRRPWIEQQAQTVRILDLALVRRERRLEPDRLQRPAPKAAGVCARPLEEREQRPRAAGLVTEVQVVAVRVVEVDGLLDQREAEPVAIEVERSLGVRADARHVMQARQLHDAGV